MENVSLARADRRAKLPRLGWTTKPAAAQSKSPRLPAVRRARRALHFLGCVAAALALGGCSSCEREPSPAGPPTIAPTGPAQVWVVDDGARVARRAGVLPLMRGEKNPIWSPGGPVRLFALRGETVALQVVVTAGSQPLSGVTVDLEELRGPAVVRSRPAGAVGGAGAIRRFRLYDLPVKRRSGGRTRGESLGWTEDSTPADPSRGGLLPDPLIPVEAAPPWAPYPMAVAAGEHGVVWIDIELGERELPAGQYRGSIQVRGARQDAAGGTQELGRIPVELELGPQVLPYAPVRTMVYFDPEEITGRIGGQKAVRQHQQLMHRHRLSTVFPLSSAAEVRAHRDALTGALYTAEQGYQGPGQGVGADVVVIGAYGALDDPEPPKLARVDAMLAELERLGIEDKPGTRDVFLYAIDEDCESDRGPRWRAALRSSASTRLRRLRVGQTCSEPPASQGVDLVMMFASAYQRGSAEQARKAGKRVWIYNGMLPHTGAFLTDGPWLSLRANAWIQASYGIERWFYWESTFWNDDNHGGQGPYDPWATAETFHNADGDHCNGDGVLVYPGRQQQGSWRSVGIDGVLPSMRLKQWRRGIADAGYLKLARRIDAVRADRIARELVPTALDSAEHSPRPPWPTEGAPYLHARRKLFELIRQGAAGPGP